MKRKRPLTREEKRIRAELKRWRSDPQYRAGVRLARELERAIGPERLAALRDLIGTFLAANLDEALRYVITSWFHDHAATVQAIREEKQRRLE